jgi:hypothetical protein
MEREMKLYNGKVYGHEVSEYGLKNGYLDYLTLSKIVGDMILNNYVMEETGYENWQIENGLEENDDGYPYEIYQYYIITAAGVRFLEEYTDEIVYYNEDLDMYLWGITHFGTSWDYVLTDIRLKEGN